MMIANNGHNGEASKSDGVGGDPKDLAVVGAFDLSDGNDRKHLRAKLVDGYEFTPERLRDYRVALDLALSIALKATTDGLRDGESSADVEYRQRYGCRQVRSIVATAKTLVDQAQAQEFVNLKLDRLDAGDPTERVAFSTEDRTRIARLVQTIDEVDFEDL